MATQPGVVLKAASHGRLRNPGPSWGFRFLRLADRVLPEAVFRPLRVAGTWTAVAAMSDPRRQSRTYLRIVLGREPRCSEIFQHFFAVCEALILRLRIANGRRHRFELDADSRDFARWLSQDRPALLGTFHIGNSDLSGYMLGGQEGRRVRMVRLRVGNSHDTEALGARFEKWLTFVWVNEPGELLIALKEACAGPDAVALQCDRPDHSSRSERFDFLGASRAFPFTIYHLALIFDRPVLLSIGLPEVPDRSRVIASPAFVPVPGEPRGAALARAREHFQNFLRRVEMHLRANPYQWLNFYPL